MKGAGERKTDTVFGNLGFELLRRNLDVDTDRLEEVEASRCRRSLSVAVFAHRGAGAGSDERCHGRDVECVGATTRGASDADDVDRGAGHVERLGRRDHRSLQPGQLLDRFTLEPETDDEGSLLRIGGMAGEDLAQDGGALGCAQVGSAVSRPRTPLQPPCSSRLMLLLDPVTGLVELSEVIVLRGSELVHPRRGRGERGLGSRRRATRTSLPRWEAVRRDRRCRGSIGRAGFLGEQGVQPLGEATVAPAMPCSTPARPGSPSTSACSARYSAWVTPQ